jgi:hypothetical protein
MSRAPAPSGEFDMGSQTRSSLMGWREAGMRYRQVQVGRGAGGPTKSAVTCDDETAPVTS